MRTSASDRRVFRGILRAVASDEFSTEDYKSALADLRSGEVSAVLENVIRILAGDDNLNPVRSQNGGAMRSKEEERDREARKRNASPSKRKPDRVTADELFDDVRRRKVTRKDVENFMSSINQKFADEADRHDTMRALLHAFRENSGSREWELLYSLINGDYESDPYLKRIVAG
jgi:hypothetical protein